ncbi:MAG TPA: hypothetical protein VMZ53_01305 [Kofleriaceae bacterium]|nr:hypothetical protein [Kofleriaceae bacterium]
MLLLALVSPLAAACTAESVDELELDEEASSKADGAAWYKLYTCNDGQAVLDVNGNERRNLQLVIRDANIIKFFNDRQVVASRYGDTELVLSGWTGYVDFGRAHGPVLRYQPYGGPGIFNRADFDRTELIANANYYYGGPFIRVFRDNAGIKVQAGRIEGRGCARTETYCPGDGFDCQTSCVDEYTEFVESANWYFNNCY